MTNLISGKEALIALANGKDVLWRTKTDAEAKCFKKQTPDLEIVLSGNCDYRFWIKPHTIAINGNECPAPILWDSLPDGTEFWIADPTRHDGEYTRYLVWDGQSCDVQHLQRGLVHLSKENAVAHAKAIILASGGKP